MSNQTEPTSQILLCSNYFTDEGLRIDAAKHGLEQQSDCPNCQSPDGQKLTLDHIKSLAWRFFVSGTTTHGEPYNGEKGYFHSYSKGKQVKSDKGEFTAIFDGTHGWFWRNRSNSDVTIALKATGDYLSVKP